MQQFHKFITWRLCMAQHVSGAFWQVPDHDQQRCYRHAPTVKPEAANAVVSSWLWARKRPKHAEPHINVT